MPKLIVITGQTATGKTQYAVKKAQEQRGELINADATQVYSHLDIVSGKDTNIIGDIPIHLLDFLDPKESFSAFDWAKLAEKKIQETVNRGNTPIVVGGTYFYISALLYGIASEGSGPDWELRRKLEKKDLKTLQNDLKKLSEEVFSDMNESDRQNPRRLMRRIEILTQEQKFKKKSSEFTPFIHKFEIECIGFMHRNKKDMRKALEERVKKRVKNGAVEEVKELLIKGYELIDPGLRSNACFEIGQYLQGIYSLEELIERWTTWEGQYSKKQYTFMKKDPNIEWKEV